MKHRIRCLHFVGIGGSGMSGIAEVLLNQGYQVQGSDLGSNTATERLSGLGARIFQGHAAEHLGTADVLVVSTAVRSDNPELQEARRRKIPIVPRALMLSELMRMKQGIAIAGTHGKTTTTSLVASLLAEAGLDPTFVIGGRLNSVGANARLGLGEAFVAEADESDGSFLNLMPMMAVITNIDADHMETYDHDMARLKQSFVAFTQRLPFYGEAIVCLDDSNVREIVPFISRPVIGYGMHPEADVRAEAVVAKDFAMAFNLIRPGRVPLPVELNLPGHHNVLNALAACTVATELGASDEAIARGLKNFTGVGRRLQRWGDLNAGDGKATLIDDYGHHPVEIAATIAAVRGAYPNRRVFLVFQPHRYSRTRDLFEDFVRVLSTVDQLVLTEVYAAGESPLTAADGRSLARAVRQLGGVDPVFAAGVEEIPKLVAALLRPGDVLITMGAGSIGTMPAKLMESFNSPMEVAHGR